MSKKVCLNLMLSSSSDEIVSLDSISSVEAVAKALGVKLVTEIAGIVYKELENQAKEIEKKNPLQAYDLWMKALYMKAVHYKNHITKVSEKQLEKYTQEFLSMLYSQIVYKLNHNRTTKATELLDLLAALSRKKFKLSEAERQLLKQRYYLL